MDSTKPEVVHDLSPLCRIYSDGRVERFLGTAVVPASLDDPTVNVLSKDVIYSHDLKLSARLYLPKKATPDQKLPLLVYFHGGGFIIETAFSPTYHNYLNLLAEEANVIVVSVDYRRAPEDPLPAAYDDSWTALKWVASHFHGNGPEEWLNAFPDFSKVSFAGDSAGGNIAHHMAMRNGQEKLIEASHLGVVLIHPYFWGKEPVGHEVMIPSEMREKIGEVWLVICPTSCGSDDPLIDPALDPNFAKLGCSRLLIFVAQKDFLSSRGQYYHDNLKKNGWDGEVEIIEHKEEDHVFHLFKPTCDNAVAMHKKIASFLNQED